MTHEFTHSWCGKYRRPIGLATIEAMRQAKATCLALDAGKTLIFDQIAVVAAANLAGIAIVVTKTPQ